MPSSPSSKDEEGMEDNGARLLGLSGHPVSDLAGHLELL